MPLQKINDIELYYEQHGTGDDLILIGGLGADHQVWKSTLRLFSRHFRVTIFDNRGAGKSSTPDKAYSIELMAKDVLQLMDALSISRANIIGHSMGGCIAQQVCLLAPQHVKKCIIACTRAKPTVLANMILSMREKLQRVNVSDELLVEYVMPFLFSEAFLKSSAHVKGFIQWTMQNPNPQSARSFANQLHAVMTHNIFDRLHEIEVPTLVIAGAEDILMPANQAEIVSKTLKNGRFMIMDGCAHMPHVEKSKEFGEIVRKFLDQV